ncbi:hypothetical protein Hanom_Chr14g01253751 [Helianthus anomalus]
MSWIMLVRRGLILMFLCLIWVIGGIAQSFLKCKENDYEAAGNNELPELKDKMNLHTMEHQRHILRMLEKSLER